MTWTVHYKNESKWCNSEQEVIETLRKIAIVQLHGENYKTWKVGEGGWRKNSSEQNAIN